MHPEFVIAMSVDNMGIVDCPFYTYCYKYDERVLRTGIDGSENKKINIFPFSKILISWDCWFFDISYIKSMRIVGMFHLV
jgi:hypothetical protein